MHKIKIMDMEQEGPSVGKKTKKAKGKIIKINDSLFEIGIRKGIIEKYEDGYYFVGDYEELLAFKTTKPVKDFKWLD